MNRILQQIALYLGLICIGFVSNLSAQADTVVFYLDTIQPLPGELIEVPIKVKNFNEVKGFQFSMEWSTDSLTYDSIGSIGLSGLGAGNFNLNMLDNGSFACVWLDPSVQGLTLPDSSTIFSLFFEPFETCDSTAEIRFTQMPTVFQVDGVDENGQDAIFPYLFLDGLVAARCPDLEADFGMNGEALTTVTACTPFELMLTDSSFGEFGINDWYWESGDGQVSTDTNATFIYSQAGTYQGQLIITDDFTQDTTTFEVVVNPGFDISFNYELDICGSTFVNFSANNLGNTNIISWNWEFGDGASANTQNASHTYNAYETNYLVRLTAIDQNGCVAFAEQTINIPEVDLVDANPFEIELPGCDTASGQITLETFGGIAPYSYTWSHDGSLTDSIASGLSPGTYTVTVTDALGCIGTTTTFLNSIDSFPVVDLGVDTSFCEGGFIQLNAGNQGTSYNWSLDGVLLSENTNQLNANQTGTYIATVTNEYNCSATDTLELDVFPLPIAELGNDTSICTGDTLLLEVPFLGEASYEWQLEGEILTSTTNTQAVFEAGTYQLAITDENGCSNTDDFQLSLFELPQITLGPDTAFCEGSSLELNAGSPINTYFWSQNGQAINNPSSLLEVAEAGNYEVIAVNPNQCAASDDIMVNILALPEVDLGADTTICFGQSITITANSGYSTYEWFEDDILIEDETLNSIEINSPGVYAVSVIDENGCKGNNGFVIEQLPNPLVEPVKDTVICTSDSVFIFDIPVAVLEGVQVNWQFNEIQVEDNFLIVDEGELIGTFVDQNNCIVSDTASIIKQEIEFIPLEDTYVKCPNNFLTLTQSEFLGNEYFWFKNDELVGTSLNLSVDEPGEFLLKIQNQSCQAFDSTVVLNGFPEDISLDTDTFYICGNEEAIVTPTSNIDINQFNIKWQFDDEIISNESILVTSFSGECVMVTSNQFGCIKRDTFDLVEINSPTYNFLNDSVFLCSDSLISLEVNDFSGVATWSINGIEVQVEENSPDVFEIQNYGNVSLQVTDTSGCVFSNSYSVELNNIPPIDLALDADSICQGDSLRLGEFIDDNFENFLWLKDENFYSNEQVIIVDEGGTYILSAIDIHNCQSRDTINVEVNELEIVSIIGDGYLCSGLSNTLFVDPPNLIDYEWYLNDQLLLGETGSSLSITETGLYKVGYLNEFGCYSEDSLEVIISAIESPSLPEDQVLCSDLLVLNTNLEEIYAYEWTLNGEVIQSANADSLIIDQPGIYTVTVFNQDNCSASDTILITQGEVPDIELGDDQVLCEGELANFMLNEGYTYAWLLDGIPINGEDSNMLTTDKSGEYMVEVESEDGCVAIDSAEVIIHPLPTIDLEDMATICPEEAYTLDANCANCTYQWSTGSGEPVIDINTPGEYAVTITNEFDCVASDTFQLNLHPAAEPDLGEDINLCFGEVVELFPGFFSTYDWSIGTDGSTITVVASNGNAGAVVDYWVDVTNPEGCMGSDTITVTFKSLIQAEITAPATDLCMGDSLFLQANGGDFYEWSIVSGDANSIASPLTDSTTVYPKENTTYQVLVANECPADLDTAYFAVNVLPLPQGDAGLDTCIARGTAIELGASGGIQYIWEENQRFPLSSLDIPNPIVAPEDNTAYTVEIIGENGCSLVDTVMVLVAEDPSINIVAVNIITPNGDGKNDFLEFDNLEKFPRNTLKVYNRWGNKVYEQVGYQNDWNGTYNGKPLPAGSYYYVLSFQASQKVVKSALTILRE